MSSKNGVARTSRLTVNLPRAVFEELKGLADDECVTVTELIRRALSAEKFLRSNLNAGNQFLVLEKGQTKPSRVLVFR